MNEQNGFTNIWNTAYDIYCEEDANAMWDYLRSLVDNNNLTQADAISIHEDVINTFNL